MRIVRKDNGKLDLRYSGSQELVLAKIHAGVIGFFIGVVTCFITLLLLASLGPK